MNKDEKAIFPMDEQGGCGIADARDTVIDRYVRHEMDEREREAFLDHILFCTECNRELQLCIGLTDALRDEPVSDPIRQEARRLLVRQEDHQSTSGLQQRATPVHWLRVAAIMLALAVVSLALYYFSAPESPPWAETALLAQEDYRPAFLQEQGNERLRQYNQGMTLLFDARQEQWLRHGIRFDRQKVLQAISKLERYYPLASPEARRMDITYYLAKAYLMLDQPGRALDWLEKSEEIAVNRAKIERAIRLSAAIEAAAQRQLAVKPKGTDSAPMRDYRQRAITIQTRLRALSAQ